MGQPFSHLVWLGAGSAVEPAGLINCATQVTLFEAREAACQALKSKYKNAAVKQAVLTSDSANITFKEYNLVEFSAIKEATGLKKFFPGLKEKSNDKITSVAIVDAISALQLGDNNNLLVMDIADSNLALLNSLAQKNLLSLFSEIQIQSSTEQLYTGAATTKEIVAFLQTQGYLLQQTFGQDPDLPWLSFALNPLWQTLHQTEEKLLAVQKELAIEKQKFEQAKAENARLRQAQEQQSAPELNAALAAANKTKQDLEQQLVKLQQELNKLKSATGPDVATNQLTFDQQMQKMFADQTQLLVKELGNIKNHISSGLNNTAKQIEAFTSIQSYLDKGIKPLNFHGWPISPDIGLHLVGLIDANNYDVIIEFGSGTSTVLMAKALLAKQRIQSAALTNIHPGKELVVQDNKGFDLPARIVTFEHNTHYHTKTRQALRDNYVDHLVDLVYAPLVDYQFKDGSQYLYYSCTDKLEEIAKILKGRKANILVLVDGPPGSTNKNARFPALPHLLNTIPEHSYTIIMDDHNRAEEKEIVELWRKICELRFLAHTIEEIPSEKGLAVIKVE